MADSASQALPAMPRRQDAVCYDRGGRLSSAQKKAAEEAIPRGGFS